MLRDFMELYRPISYLLSFLFGYYMAKDSTSISNYIGRYRILLFSVFGIVLLAILSFMLFDVFGKYILSFYTKDHNVFTRRLTGTFNNPYDFAFVALLPFCYAFISYLRLGNYRMLLIALVSLLAVILSQSKAGFLSLIFCFSLIYLFYPFVFSIRKISVAQMGRLLVLPVIGGIASISFILYMGDQISYLMDGINKLLEGQGDKSTNIRILQVEFVINSFINHPYKLFFGFGPSKATVEFLEMLPLLYLYRYGILGLVILGYWIAWGTFICYTKAKLENVETMKLIYFATFTWFASVLTSGIGNNVIDQSRVSFIYFCLIGFFTYSLPRHRLLCKII